MSAKILWLDDDRTFLSAHIFNLRMEGHEVKQVFTMAEATDEINSGKYNLLILDIMMSVSRKEEGSFPAAATNSGHKAGVAYYVSMKQLLKDKNIKVFVFTIREDEVTHEELIKAGLERGNYMKKSEGRNIDVFLAKIKEILQQST